MCGDIKAAAIRAVCDEKAIWLKLCRLPSRIENLCAINKLIRAGKGKEIEKRLKIDLTCGNYDSRRGLCMSESGLGRDCKIAFHFRRKLYLFVRLFVRLLGPYT